MCGPNDASTPAKSWATSFFRISWAISFGVIVVVSGLGGGGGGAAVEATGGVADGGGPHAAAAAARVARRVSERSGAGVRMGRPVSRSWRQGPVEKDLCLPPLSGRPRPLMVSSLRE